MVRSRQPSSVISLCHVCIVRFLLGIPTDYLVLTFAAASSAADDEAAENGEKDNGEAPDSNVEHGLSTGILLEPVVVVLPVDFVLLTVRPVLELKLCIFRPVLWVNGDNEGVPLVHRVDDVNFR